MKIKRNKMDFTFIGIWSAIFTVQLGLLHVIHLLSVSQKSNAIKIAHASFFFVWLLFPFLVFVCFYPWTEALIGSLVASFSSVIAAGVAAVIIMIFDL